MRLGVCSWSLQPTGPDDLVEKVHACGMDAVQLALDPIRSLAWDERRTREALDRAGVAILSGMMAMRDEDYTTLETIKLTGGVRPDATWPDNLAAAHANAELAGRLGLGLVTFHAGFIPHGRNDRERGVMLTRLREVIDAFALRGVRTAFETGQEPADKLVELLGELPAGVGVNFDPANMILYGSGDEIGALRRLAPRVAQMHVKDARRSARAGEWGEEVPAGTGDVRWRDFFDIYRREAICCNLVVEREAGNDRVRDASAGAALVREAIRLT